MSRIKHQTQNYHLDYFHAHSSCMPCTSQNEAAVHFDEVIDFEDCNDGGDVREFNLNVIDDLDQCNYSTTKLANISSSVTVNVNEEIVFTLDGDYEQIKSIFDKMKKLVQICCQST